MSCCASQVWTRALRRSELARRGGDRLAEAQAWLDIDGASGHLPAPADALAALLHAQRVFAAHHQPERAAMAHAACAKPLHDLGRECDAIAFARTAFEAQGLPAEVQLRGLIRVALAHVDIGEADLALSLLQQQALPLAQALGSAGMLAHWYWACAVAQLRLLIEQELPEAFATWHLHRASPVVTAREVLRLLDAAEHGEADSCRQVSIDLVRQAVLGLSGSPEPALAALIRHANKSIATPLQAARAQLFKGLIHCRQAHWPAALAALEQAGAVADAHGCAVLSRDALLHHSWVSEKVGDHQRALASHRRFAALLLRGATRSAQRSEGVATAAPAAELQPRTLEPAQVKQALRFIEEHLAEPLDVGAVVSHCRVSRRNLEVLFKQSRSTTIAAYIKARKLDRAAALLHDTRWPVQEIARAVGVASASALSRDFRARFGLSPVVWRQNAVPAANR